MSSKQTNNGDQTVCACARQLRKASQRGTIPADGDWFGRQWGLDCTGMIDDQESHACCYDLGQPSADDLQALSLSFSLTQAHTDARGLPSHSDSVQSRVLSSPPFKLPADIPFVSFSFFFCFSRCASYAFPVHRWHLLTLHFVHSKMTQWGPEWQRLQFHMMMVVSDLIDLNRCSQLPGTAIVFVG